MVLFLNYKDVEESCPNPDTPRSTSQVLISNKYYVNLHMTTSFQVSTMWNLVKMGYYPNQVVLYFKLCNTDYHNSKHYSSYLFN